ncbi:MAG: DUF4159 domain-containing protein [Alphaproteobacteria bacterium]|nr:DUF4159 domain-containing protein [Alphaproteobacteria bacterium]
MRRRDLLAAGAAALALPGRALAFGEGTRLDICELDLGPGTLSRPNAWKRLLYEVQGTTSVECEPRAVRVRPDDPALFEHPFAVLLGDGRFQIDDAGAEQLERYLSYGGFLLIDDCAAGDGPFDSSVRALIDRLFPTRPLNPLPSDHSLYRSFFLLKRPLGRVDRYAVAEGVTFDNMTPLVYVRNDLSGALDRGDDGRPAHSCVPGGEGQRREAIKLGINLVLYALTSNYKKDQAHVRQLMKEGRLE